MPTHGHCALVPIRRRTPWVFSIDKLRRDQAWRTTEQRGRRPTETIPPVNGPRQAGRRPTFNGAEEFTQYWPRIRSLCRSLGEPIGDGTLCARVMTIEDRALKSKPSPRQQKHGYKLARIDRALVRSGNPHAERADIMARTSTREPSEARSAPNNQP